MRRVLAISTALALMLTSGGVVTAQEEGGSPTAAGAFTPGGSLNLARTGHTATLLPDGRVLIVGGQGGDGILASAELFDPSTGDFVSTGALAQARVDHTAKLLPDGRVLIDGGRGDSAEPVPTEATDDLWGGLFADLRPELYDPATATFQDGGTRSLSSRDRDQPSELARSGHTTTLLPDGRTLVVGGSRDGEHVAQSALLDPETRDLIAAGSLTEPRSGHTATFLRDGRVLVVGGEGFDGLLASVELWTSAAKPARCLDRRPTLFAQPGVELVGTAGNDVIAGSIGDDLIRGGGGNDRICGYEGDDTIDGGAGNDTIDGGAGSDMVTGAGGRDRLLGAGGNDELSGGKGKDVCIGGAGIDWLPSCNEARRTRGTISVTRNTKLKGPHYGRFEIARDGVTLDCDGHTVTGAGPELLSGISLFRRRGVTVRNCDVRDFYHGVQLDRSHRNTVSNNRVSNVGWSGIDLMGSDRNRLVANSVADAGCCGYNLIVRSDRNRLRDNVAERGRRFGFYSLGNSNTFADNIARNTDGAGFFVEPEQGSRAANNTFSGNAAIGNSLGFHDGTNGFTGDAGTDNRYVDNTCIGNKGGGSNPPTLCAGDAP